MNNIKMESDNTVCRGCLSSDRRLSPIVNYQLYFSLLEEKQKIEASRKPFIIVCWECAAALRRLQVFRARAQRAHTILEESLSTPVKHTLSHLGIRIKDKYDACFEDSKSIEQCSQHRLESVDVIKNETSNVELKETSNEIKEESTNCGNKKSSVPPKKRKTTAKRVEVKKRKVSFDEPLINLKLESTNAKRKTKESKRSKTVKKEKHKKKVDIEVCNVNNYENETDKVEVKVECLSDNIDDDVHWMQGSSFDDDDKPNNEIDDSLSGYNSSKDDKRKSKDDKKRIFTFKKTVMKFSSDALSYFAEIEMSEDEMKSVLEKQRDLVNKSKPYRCEFCGTSFKQRKTLDGHVNHSHRKAMHKDQVKKEAPDPEQGKHFLYRCSLCDRMLPREHTQSHIQEYHRYKYHCLGCSWSKAFFWCRDDHARHWQAVHAQLECDLCKQTRRNTHDMERHMRASHLPIRCPQCPRVYSKWKYYRQHQKLAHPVLAQEPPESRYCVECDMQFPSIMAYKMHVMNQHRSTPKKRWPCPACNKTLNNKDTMKKHYALFHSDKTSYQCQHCGKYLSSKCSLQHHLNSHLNIKLPKDKLCSICGRGFSTKRMLRFHTYTHTGERPYACAHCPAAFTQPNPLRVHARKQHPLLPAPLPVPSNPNKIHQ